MRDPFWLEFAVRSHQEHLRHEAESEHLSRLAQDVQRRLAGRRRRYHHALWQIGSWLVTLGAMLQARSGEEDVEHSTDLDMSQEALTG